MAQSDPYPHYIEFRHIHKTFDHPVLVDCNFHVNPGETVAIIGRSGVGKSVTLGNIMGFIKPDSGRVIVAHEDVTDYSETEWRRVRRKVTMVFQSGALFDSLTVAENVQFSLELREDYDLKNKEDVVNGLLQMVDIADAAEAYPADLSTGYKRAVAIARALAAQPQCVLYDEPTTMVDPIMSDHLGDLMLRLKKQLKLTSVVVTHDLDLMYKVADRVVFLYDGGVIYFGPVADLDKSKHPHIQEFLEMDKVLRVCRSTRGVRRRFDTGASRRSSGLRRTRPGPRFPTSSRSRRCRRTGTKRGSRRWEGSSGNGPCWRRPYR